MTFGTETTKDVFVPRRLYISITGSAYVKYSMKHIRYSIRYLNAGRIRSQRITLELIPNVATDLLLKIEPLADELGI